MEWSTIVSVTCLALVLGLALFQLYQTDKQGKSILLMEQTLGALTQHHTHQPYQTQTQTMRESAWQRLASQQEPLQPEPQSASPPQRLATTSPQPVTPPPQ